jgi:hypothetical protein
MESRRNGGRHPRCARTDHERIAVVLLQLALFHSFSFPAAFRLIIHDLTVSNTSIIIVQLARRRFNCFFFLAITLIIANISLLR